MNEKNIIIIIAIIVVAIACAGIFLFTTQNNTTPTQYTTIALSESCSIQVPVSDKAVTSTDNYGIKFYIDSKNNLNVTSFNSEEGVALSGAVQMASIRDNIQIGSTPIVTDDGITVYQNPNTKLYSIFIGNNTTHDNILIVSSDLDTLLHAYKSIKYGEVDKSNETVSISKNKTNSSDRYVQDENGLFDKVTGKYVGGQFDGSTKEEVARYHYEISHEGEYSPQPDPAPAPEPVPDSGGGSSTPASSTG
jgi:hypothetical protein